MTSNHHPVPRNARSKGQSERLSIELGVPASVDYLHTIRSVVGRAGHLLGFTFDGIEDLALAVDEAASLLLDLGPQRILLQLQEASSGELDIRLVTEPARDWPPPALSSDTRWHIVEALIDRCQALTGATTGIQLTQARI